MSDEHLGLPPDEDNAEAGFEGMSSEEILDRLVEMNKLERAQARAGAAKALGIYKSELDSVLKDRLASRTEPEVVELDVDALAASASEIIECEDILGLFEADWSRMIAGEVQIGKLLYLIATSRLFPKPMNAAIKGVSSSGKSETRKAALMFFPSEDIISFTTLSEKALLHVQGDLSHKILSMGEAAGADEQSLQNYLIRELISEGRLVYPMTTKGPDGKLETIIIIVEGPVSFMVTTTAVELFDENETRIVSLDIDDSTAQTKAIFLKIAELEDGSDRPEIDFTAWQDFQRWLRVGETTVVVPYARPLLENVPPKAVRQRRDVTQLLGAIKAHALVHRTHRERDGRGRIVADIEHDYAVVRVLMHDLLSEAVEANISDTIAKTIEAVADLTKDLPEDEGVTQKAVGAHLGLDKSNISRRISKARRGGYIRNLESRKGHPHKYRLAEEMPKVEEVLPSLERLRLLHPHPTSATAQLRNFQPVGDTEQGVRGCGSQTQLQRNTTNDGGSCATVAPGCATPQAAANHTENEGELRGCARRDPLCA